MPAQLLITAWGEDRPGIVARITETFFLHAANLQESRMSILGGEFAAIMLISVEESKQEKLLADLEKLSKEGISVSSKKTGPLAKERFKAHKPYKVLLSGADHEGIVYRVSAYLRDHNVNIQSADTELLHAPHTASPLFQMQALVLVPPELSHTELKRGLESIAAEECVEIELAEAAAQIAV